MRKSMNTNDEKQARRVQADRVELAERIAKGISSDGRLEVQPGVFFNRLSVPNRPVHGVLAPSFCVIAQGSKDILLGDECFHYDPAHYLITTLGLPLTAQVVEEPSRKPYLGFRLVLDPSVVTSVMVESARCSAAKVAGSRVWTSALSTRSFSTPRFGSCA